MKSGLKSLNHESVSSLLDRPLKFYEGASLVISDEFWKNFNFGLERTSNELIPYIESKIKPRIRDYLIMCKEGFLDFIRRDLPDIKTFALCVSIPTLLSLNIINSIEIDPMNEHYKRLYSRLDLSQKLAYHQIVEDTKNREVGVVKNIPGLEGILVDDGASKLHRAYWSKENDDLGYRWSEKEVRDIFNFDALVKRFQDPLKKELTGAQINEIPILVRNFGNIKVSEKIEWIKKLNFHESLGLNLEEAYDFLGGKLILESRARDFKVYETPEGMRVIGPVESNKGALYSHQVLPKTKEYVEWLLNVRFRGSEFSLRKYINEKYALPIERFEFSKDSRKLNFVTTYGKELSLNEVLNSWLYGDEFKELILRFVENFEVLRFYYSLPSEVDQSNFAGLVYAKIIADELGDETTKIRGRELDKPTLVAASYNCGGNRRKTGNIFWGSVTNYADQLIKKDMVLFKDLRPVIDALETTREYEELGMHNIELLPKIKFPRTYNSTLVNNYPKL